MGKEVTRRRLLSGWRASAVALLLATATLSIILCSLLLSSMFRLGNGWTSWGDTSILFSGSCKTSSRFNLGLHFILNIISSAILASSNFFMQILLAPTREDVDKAHARSLFAEIGVQSFRNLKIVPPSNVIIWVLLAATSVPLHLVFNSCILESRGSTKFLMVVGSDGFTKGAEFIAPGVGAETWYDSTQLDSTLADIQHSLSISAWERLNLADCWERYNDGGATLTDHRHVVLVISNQNESETTGWTPREIRFNATADDFPYSIMDSRNSLFFTDEFDRTDAGINQRAQYEDPEGYSLDDSLSDRSFHMDLASGSLISEPLPYYGNLSHNHFNDEHSTFNAQYCLSEAFTTACKLEVENSLLSIVCLVCLIKCILCIGILVKLRNIAPLVTPGDAIESFIINPDAITTGMCSLSRNDFAAQEKKGGGWIATAKKLSIQPMRSMIAVPRLIWSWSYILIGLSIATSLIFLIQATRARSVASSYFGHDPRNPNVWISGLLEKAGFGPNTATLSILANLPQLILSICYLAYNGLLTRIFAEFEWASYGQAYKPLRVTLRKGEQRSTYRLQLPLRWSIPLLIISILLHWLFSNCLYIIIYESYDAYYPYETSSFRWLQFSPIAILISLLFILVLASVPLVLGYCTLPGGMVVAGNSSAVISAACHCVTAVTSRLLHEKGNIHEVIEEEDGENELWRIATGRIKWGVVSSERSAWSDEVGIDVAGVGHLAFGLNDVGKPKDGIFYAG